MERVEETLSALMPALESHEIGHWEASEVELLCALLKEYGSQARTSTAKQVGGHASSPDEDEESEEDEEGDEEEEEDEDALFVAAIGEVDRGLSRARDYLKSRLPYGAHPEPTQQPSAAAAAAAAVVNSKKRARSPEAPTALVTAPVYAVDSFLYSEDDINELVEEKKLAREYCSKCGCTDIRLAEFITHSFSQDQLVYLSCFLFPHVLRQVISAAAMNNRDTKKSKQVSAPLRIVDVGSRLGVVLWACALALQRGALVQPPSEDDEEDEDEEEEPEVHITGVEVDAAYVKISQDVLRRFFTPRKRQAPRLDRGDDNTPAAEEVMDVSSQLHLVQSDCFVGDGAAAIAEASLVVLHNVFEFFSPSPVEHAMCWLKLRSLVRRRGQFLVCSPALEETLSGFTTDVWAAAWSAVEGMGKREMVPPLQWLASFVERVDVTEVGTNFLSMRALARDHDGEDDSDDDADSGAGHGHSHGSNGHDHGHSHSHGHSHGDGDHHGHSHGHSGHGEGHDSEDEEASEVAEEVQKIFVYRVL